MDCIPYIEDLLIEIAVLEIVRDSGDCDIDSVNKQIEQKQKLVDECKRYLKKLSDCNIEYRLYLKLLSGIKPSQAVKEVSDENYCKDIKPNSISSIWRSYKNLQKKIKKI